LWIDPADANTSYIFPGSHNNRPVMTGFDLKEWYYDIFHKQYWKCVPYLWEPQIDYPPFYGTAGDPDIKSDPSVKDKINEAIIVLKRQLKVVNELLRSTCVVQLERVISEIVDERSDAPVYPPEVFVYNAVDDSTIFSIQNVEAARLERMLLLNSPELTFDKSKDYVSSSKELIRRCKELKQTIHNWKEYIEDDF
jgi:hypothetical protein